MHLVIGLILSAGVGLSLGLIGGGGSIITVPLLVYVIGVDVHQAVGMSLAVIGVTSVIGTILHHRNGSVSLTTGSLFAGSGILGALGGAWLSYLVAPETLMLVFAGLLFVTAGSMLLRRQGRDSADERRAPSPVKAVMAGAVVGLVTGFLGVGGGFLVVPALMLFGGLTMHEAVGTSLFVIAANSAAGLIGHLQHGGFDPVVASLVTALAAAGMVVGANLSARVPAHRLKFAFALFVLAVAILLVVRNHSALL